MSVERADGPAADDADPLPPGPDRLAGIGPRVAARLLDGLIVGVPLTVLAFATSTIDSARNTVDTPVAVQVLVIVVLALYEVVLIHTRGQTIGKRVMGIQVVRVNDGALPDWSAAIARYLVPSLPALVPIPGFFLLSIVVYLVALTNPLRRGWHDRAAGTIVVRVEPAVESSSPTTG